MSSFNLVRSHSLISSIPPSKGKKLTLQLNAHGHGNMHAGSRVRERARSIIALRDVIESKYLVLPDCTWYSSNSR